MSAGELLSEVGLSAGGRLALHPGHLVHAAGERTETMALAHLAAVRIGFEREAGKLAAAATLAALALLLALAGPPLAAAARGLAADRAAAGRAEPLDALLHSVFAAIAAVAAAMPAAAAVLFAAAGVCAALGWYGRTTLTLAFAASERTFSVRGRDAALFAFAEALAERLAEITRRS